jgi:hypothetical protein
MPVGGQRTAIAPGLIARLSGALKGMRDGWFGPSQPLEVIAPPEVRGRQFDFPVGFNLVQAPRLEQGEGGIDFKTLRALADPGDGGLDLLRLAIETRKDQMEAQRWSIRGRDGSDGGDKARAIEKALRKPDLVSTFSVWQRMLVEDLLVIDAPCIYLAPTLEKKYGGLGYRIPQVMDGATLKRLIGSDGRTPLPPGFAFQQVLKGVPAVDYTLDELVYAPRNLRSYRVYGMSPVQQVTMTVTIALRRQLSQLEYYTAGAVPDIVFSVPKDWSADQIKAYESWWNAKTSGNSEERRRAHFVPEGMTPTLLKPEQLKDEFDEWLAKIVCYAFSLSPQALIKQMNRASAQTSKQTAQEEGLEPIKRWWKDVMDDVLGKGFDEPDLEYAYEDEEIADPQVKAEVTSIALGGKPWLTPDEARADYGKEKLTPEQLAQLNPVPPAAPERAPGGAPGEEPPPGAAKIAKRRARRVKFHRDASNTITAMELEE